MVSHKVGFLLILFSPGQNGPESEKREKHPH